MSNNWEQHLLCLIGKIQRVASKVQCYRIYIAQSLFLTPKFTFNIRYESCKINTTEANGVLQMLTPVSFPSLSLLFCFIFPLNSSKRIILIQALYSSVCVRVFFRRFPDVCPPPLSRSNSVPRISGGALCVCVCAFVYFYHRVDIANKV